MNNEVGAVCLALAVIILMFYCLFLVCYYEKQLKDLKKELKARRETIDYYKEQEKQLSIKRYIHKVVNKNNKKS